MRFFSKLKQALNSGSNRTKIVKRNVLASFAVKGLSIITSLLLVPATLNLIDSEKYGLWITIYAIVSWFNMMDIGLGNGFRNKFAAAISLKKYDEAKEYLSTLYTSTIIISLAIITIYSLIGPFLNWSAVLNISKSFDEDINKIFAYVFYLFAIQLSTKNITTILLALQQTALSNFIIFLGNLLALIIIFTLGKTGMATLHSISLTFMIAPIVIWLIATIFLFSTSLKRLRRIKISVNRFGEIMGLGIKFFIIQVASIIMFSSGNLIITRIYGPSEVTPYNIAFRLFSSSITFFGIIKAPFWTAYTDAYSQRDFHWMKQSIRKLIQLWLFFSAIILVVLFFSEHLYSFWLGDKVYIPFCLSFHFAVYAILLSWSGVFSQFLNGIGLVKIQLIIAIFQGVNVIPLGIVLSKYAGLGSCGVILAINLNLCISAFFLYVQSQKILNHKAKDLWAQ